MARTLTHQSVATTLLLKLWDSKDINSMDDDEFTELVKNLQVIREMRTKKAKEKSHLDMLLDMLNFDKSRILHEEFKRVRKLKEEAEKEADETNNL